MDLGAFFFEGREEKARGAAAEFGGVDVAVVTLLFVGGDHDEGAEAEIDVLFDRDALGDQAFEGVVLDRGKADLLEPGFESGGGREIAERLGNFGGDLFIRRSRTRQPLGLEGEDPLVDKYLQCLIEVLGSWLFERNAGLERHLPNDVGIGDKLRFAQAVGDDRDRFVHNLLRARRKCRHQHEQGDHSFLADLHVLLVFHSVGCGVNDWRVSILLATVYSLLDPAKKLRNTFAEPRWQAEMLALQSESNG